MEVSLAFFFHFSTEMLCIVLLMQFLSITKQVSFEDIVYDNLLPFKHNYINKKMIS